MPQQLTRIDFVVPVLAGAATYTPPANVEQVDLAAPTAAWTLNAPAGTPLDGALLLMRVRVGTSTFAPTFNAVYASSGIATLPTTAPPASKIVQMGFRYDATRAKWILIALDWIGY